METTALALLGALIVLPAVVAALLLAVRADKPRTFITVIGALAIACLSVLAAAVFLPQSSQGALYFAVPEGVAEGISYVTIGIDLVLAAYIIGKGLASKDNSVSNQELVRVNEEIRTHPIEIVGKKLRGYMTAMKAIVG